MLPGGVELTEWRKFSTLLSLLLGLLITSTQTVSATAATSCPPKEQVLSGVWSPDRLSILNSCQTASGTVVKIERETDGDVDIYLSLDPSYDYLSGSPEDVKSLQRFAGESNLLVELMPRDGGYFPTPSAGDHVIVTGAWVTDEDHGWKELHPVWELSINEGPVYRSGPQHGGSSPDSSFRTAVSECHTEDGTECVGYGITKAKGKTKGKEKAKGKERVTEKVKAMPTSRGYVYLFNPDTQLMANAAPYLRRTFHLLSLPDQEGDG